MESVGWGVDIIWLELSFNKLTLLLRLLMQTYYPWYQLSEIRLLNYIVVFVQTYQYIHDKYLDDILTDCTILNSKSAPSITFSSCRTWPCTFSMFSRYIRDIMSMMEIVGTYFTAIN